MEDTIWAIICVAFFLWFYMLPYFVALKNNSKYGEGTFFIANALFNILIIPWIVFLIMALCTENTKQKTKTNVGLNTIVPQKSYESSDYSTNVHSDNLKYKRREHAKNEGYWSIKSVEAIQKDSLRETANLLDEVFWEYFALDEDYITFNKEKPKKQISINETIEEIKIRIAERRARWAD